MFTYADGSPIKAGDSVLLENGQTPGTVELVVLMPSEMQAIGVEEPGVMLLSPPFGRIYLPEWSLRREPLEFVSHGPSALQLIQADAASKLGLIQALGAMDNLWGRVEEVC
ncbi:hypothetical protein [Xanthomonas sp. D-99]|uniref:hypothetical protein n=1 Tax=Xanthomonas sp. D-99 TaxID=2821273 RepID=UPI001ADAC0FC|nr:hypothetical protein [Xanthomonas sp. D-99]MBO9876088.1 hypothetical protein [Xanthomonas sp. D-99]